MRISIDRDDPGFCPSIERYAITLDNAPVINAITADEELGLIRLLGDGGLEILIGNVKIERKN